MGFDARFPENSNTHVSSEIPAHAAIAAPLFIPMGWLSKSALSMGVYRKQALGLNANDCNTFG
jgi:hypothetical protein